MDAREISPRTATQARENAMDAGSSALLERCARIGSSTWSDALDEFGIDGVVRGLIQRSGRDRCAGFAVTIKQSTGRLGAYPRGDFGAGKIVEASGPGRVAMVDMGGAEVSTFGGLAALASSMRGATGIAIDGAARDIDEIRATGVWLASRFVTPTTGKKRVRLEAFGQPVTIGGVTVRQGDLVIGDETGIVVVPKEDLDRVLGKAEKFLEMDLAMEQSVKAGKSFAQAAAAADYI
jgi:3-hexulose-6-phosphate synthase / 6-phospho-3-hexuloisomerase